MNDQPRKFPLHDYQQQATDEVLRAFAEKVATPTAEPASTAAHRPVMVVHVGSVDKVAGWAKAFEGHDVDFAIIDDAHLTLPADRAAEVWKRVQEKLNVQIEGDPLMKMLSDHPTMSADEARAALRADGYRVGADGVQVFDMKCGDGCSGGGNMRTVRIRHVVDMSDMFDFGLFTGGTGAPPSRIREEIGECQVDVPPEPPAPRGAQWKRERQQYGRRGRR